MNGLLHIIGSFHQGGTESQAVQLVRLLAEEGIELKVACLDGKGVLREEIERAGFTDIPEFPLSSFFDLNMIRQIRRCVRFISENKIEMVQTHDFYTNVFGTIAARIAGVKWKIASKRETGGMRSKAQSRIETLLLKRADAVVANSAAVKRCLTDQGVDAGRIHVIYNGLDLSRFETESKTRAEICEELNLPAGDDVRFITLVANLRHPVKNHPMFLNSAKNVAERFPDAHFVLAGEGELKEDLELIADQLKIADRTHFIGRCRRIPELLSVSFAGVLTSFAEGFANSILECMAAGLPVVATDVGGASEAVVDGRTGFLVGSNDVGAMSEKLVWLLENPEQAGLMGLAGQRIVKSKFSCRSQLLNTLELYGKLRNAV